MDQFCGSQFWDWNLTWYTDSPDFTPCFERTVFTAIPCFFIWVFSSIDIYSSYNSNLRDTSWSPLTSAKLSLTAAIIFLEIGMMIETTLIIPSFHNTYSSYPVDIFVPTTRVITLIFSIVLLVYSKKKGVRSSAVQFIFWLLFVITQTIRFRTVILQSQQNDNERIALVSSQDLVIFIIEVIYFLLMLSQFILHCWADTVPNTSYSLNLPPEKNTCPDSNSSFLSKILFEWYTPLVWSGFRKPLEYSDLWGLSRDISSAAVIPTFDRYWPNNLNIRPVETNSKFNQKTEKQNGKVFTTLLKAFGCQYLGGFFTRSMTDLLSFVQPFILNLLIDFVESDYPIWKGIMYAAILFLNALIAIIFNANGAQILFKTVICTKTALVSAVYRKSLLLSNSSRKTKSCGEIVNHMAVDAQYAAEFINQSYVVITAPIIVLIALYFLWTILGISALAGVVVISLILPLNAFLASRVQKLQKKQMAFKDRRTKLMTEILNGVKCIKLYAWEPSFEKQVQMIRENELKILKKIAYWDALSNFLWSCAPFMVAIGSFGTFVLIDSSNVLDAQTAFVSLSLFNIMSQPLKFLPFFISNIIQASVGIKRLNEFLNAEEIDNDAVTHDMTNSNPVSIKNGTFSWVEDGTTLQNINLEVRDCELVAVVGKVGCGKSSVLSVLLNELVRVEGSANIRGTIGYVAQQAWIQNASVRDNILFGRKYDPAFYNRVVEACALIPDLEILPAGDKTEIGEKGINLSGGQKQRIALARAVYSNSDIFLLDDPLSAVDAHVGKHIFDEVLGPRGLLRKKTRLLVTHSIVYLPFMDTIVVLANGKIRETGSYQQLISKNGAFSDFIKQHSSSPKDNELEEKSPKVIERSLSTISSDCQNKFTDHRKNSVVSSVTSSKSNLKPEENKLIEKEIAQTDSVKSSVYFDYFRAAGWTLVISTLVMQLIFQGFSVGANLWLSKWTNSPANSSITKDNNFYLAIYGALGFFQAISVVIASIVLALGTVKSSNVLHLEMLKGVLRAPLQFFDVTPSGRIINRFAKDVDTMDNSLPMRLRFLVSGIFSVLAILVVISVSTPIFTVVIAAVGVLYYLIQRVYIATTRQLKRLESISKSPIFSHFAETVAGVSTIRAFGHEERFILESERRQDHNIMSYYSMLTSNRWLQIRLGTVGNLLVFFAALFAVLGRETLSAGMVGLSVSYALQITGALMVLVRFFCDVESYIVCVERIKEYSDCPQEAPWSTSVARPDHDWPQNGKIVFDQYKARYRPGLELVLKNVTCEIKAGEKVGIVGRTGAGKSSVTLGLFRIVEAAGGKIMVDGMDISKLGLHDVRGRIAIIPQEPMLFSGSLKLNLDPFEKKRDEELWRALELAHLKSFVDGLPGGLNYEISECGGNLSVGQRQLVCLARALLRKTKILILDEFTSAVDLDTEELILKTIRSEFKEATVLTIAHRLNTIMDSDRVIVLDEGEIKEFDTPESLMAYQSSIFFAMASEAAVRPSQ